MEGFKYILLYSTAEKGSRPTFARILDLAQFHQARLHVVDTLEPPPSGFQRLFSSSVRTNLRETEEAGVRKRLDRLVASARERGVETTSEVLFGKPFIELIRTAVHRNCDLVVKTARRVSGITERIMGSTALHLMRKCPIPVLIVQPKRRIQIKRILVPLDFREGHASEESLNSSIMDKALSMAGRDTIELHFLHVWQPYGVSILSSGRVRMRAEKIMEYVSSYGIKQKTRFEEFLHRYALNHVKHRDHFVRGEAATVIPELARRHRINLIVMGSTYSLGLGGVFMGSTAEQVLSVVNCSILTVKPQGFVTPVNTDQG